MTNSIVVAGTCCIRVFTDSIPVTYCLSIFQNGVVFCRELNRLALLVVSFFGQTTFTIVVFRILFLNRAPHLFCNPARRSGKKRIPYWTRARLVKLGTRVQFDVSGNARTPTRMDPAIPTRRRRFRTEFDLFRTLRRSPTVRMVRRPKTETSGVRRSHLFPGRNRVTISCDRRGRTYNKRTRNRISVQRRPDFHALTRGNPFRCPHRWGAAQVRGCPYTVFLCLIDGGGGGGPKRQRRQR